MVDLTDADICNVIRAERKAATDAEREESQKTIHMLTEQREDYRKQVVFLEGRIRGLEGKARAEAGYRIALERVAALDPTLPIGKPADASFFIRQAQEIARKALGRHD